jgi:hypothetical protein
MSELGNLARRYAVYRVETAGGRQGRKPSNYMSRRPRSSLGAPHRWQSIIPSAAGAAGLYRETLSRVER